jgi:hemolysin III
MRAVAWVRAVLAHRPQSVGEEIANSVSHGLAFLLAIAALPVLLHACAADGAGALDIAAVSVFGATMTVLYGVSSIYHALPVGRWKAVFSRFDHAAIYLFIAGSYTPFALGALRHGPGWTLFGVVWVLAAFGALAKMLNRMSHLLLSTTLYVAMGWLVVFAVRPLLDSVSPAGIAWLLAGGACYTLGAVVFLFDSRVRYAHFAWHLLVVGGSACHFFAALWHAR